MTQENIYYTQIQVPMLRGISSETQTGQRTDQTDVQYDLGTVKNEIVKQELNLQNHHENKNTEIDIPPDIKEYSFFKKEIRDQEDNLRNYTIFPTLSWLSRLTMELMEVT